jgi:SepF-like predicted cell division protein (DUF552 family)
MMKNFIRKLKGRDDADDENAGGDEFIELGGQDGKEGKNKFLVRPFALTDFADVKPILDVIREGYTICLINIRPLKDKDVVELKRAINKLKKTVEAVDGDIAGFSEDYLVITPSFGEIYKGPGGKGAKKEGMSEVEEEE